MPRSQQTDSASTNSQQTASEKPGEQTKSPSKDPTLRFETEYFRAGVPIVIGIDEVGRGAIAGPVAVGAHAVFAGTTSFPEGLRDSKLLSETRREALAPLVAQWGVGAVGYASAAEIDAYGISRCLGMAGRRALLELHKQLTALELGVPQALVIVDGKHDWLTPELRAPLRVITRVGGDRECASISAASIRAKVDRDALMREAHDAEPGYSWASNKGYGSKAHYEGIETFGLSVMHRRSFLRNRNVPEKPALNLGSARLAE